MVAIILLYIIFQDQLCSIYNVLKKSFFKLNQIIKSVFIDYQKLIFFFLNYYCSYDLAQSL